MALENDTIFFKTKCKCCGDIIRVTHINTVKGNVCDACEGNHNYATPDKGLGYLINPDGNTHDKEE